LALGLRLRVVALALPRRRPVGTGTRILCRGHPRPILRAGFRLLPSGFPADSGSVRTLVAVVICGLVVLPAGASASPAPTGLVRTASRLSGLPVRRPVQTAIVPASRYTTMLARAWSRDYPSFLRRADATA